jgi:hypothetical protein
MRALNRGEDQTITYTINLQAPTPSFKFHRIPSTYRPPPTPETHRLLITTTSANCSMRDSASIADHIDVKSKPSARNCNTPPPISKTHRQPITTISAKGSVWTV